MGDSIWLTALTGLLAGLAIAMPLGAIGVLILREAMLNGVRAGLAAAAGVAVVDTFYCALAVGAGSVAAPIISAWGAAPGLISGIVLIGLGLHQLWSGLRRRPSGSVGGEVPHRAIFAKFIALTAINPATLLYFLSLAGMALGSGTQPLAPVVFVIGTGFGSLAWQVGLALVGAKLGTVLPQRLATVLTWVASGMIVALGVGVILTALA